VARMRLRRPERKKKTASASERGRVLAISVLGLLDTQSWQGISCEGVPLVDGGKECECVESLKRVSDWQIVDPCVAQCSGRGGRGRGGWGKEEVPTRAAAAYLQRCRRMPSLHEWKGDAAEPQTEQKISFASVSLRRQPPNRWLAAFGIRPAAVHVREHVIIG
jgi:hypothetical protein